MAAIPPSDVSDPERLAILASFRILDTPPEQTFDDIVAIARTVCQTPVALVSLVAEDRQWFKARAGFGMAQTPLDQSVCAHALGQTSLLIIPDLTLDERTKANGLVTGEPHIRFYAGAPLISPQGKALGTLCVVDVAPRAAGLTADQTEALQALARQVVHVMVMRRSLEARNDALVDERLTGNVYLGRAVASEAIGDGLRALENRLRGAQEAARVGAFEIDLTTDRLFPTTEFCRLFGIPATTDIPTEHVIALILPEDKAAGSTPASRFDGTAAIDTEYRIRRPSDGSIRWLSRRSAFEPDIEGKPIRMLGVVQDITAQKLASSRQEALLALGDQLREATTIADAVERSSAILGRTLDVQRAGYATVDGKAESFTVEQDWTAPGTASLRGRYPIALFSATVGCLKSGDPLVVADLSTSDDLTADADCYARIAARSMIKAPLLSSGDLVGVLFVHSSAPRAWDEAEVSFVKAVADRTDAAVAKLRAETDQALLNEELSHRMKNSLAMVQAIAKQTLRNPADKAAAESFDRRLVTLSKAHDILLLRQWSAARIRPLIASVLALHGDVARFDVAGPDLDFGPKAALSLSMLLHELTTNALKHGSLSSEAGRVSLTWSVDQGETPTVTMRWEELNGPPTAAPGRRGFGSRLIAAGLAGTGETELRYLESGLVAEFRAPLSNVVGS